MRFPSVLRRPAGLEVYRSFGPVASESQITTSADIGRRFPTDRNQSAAFARPFDADLREAMRKHASA